MSILLEIIVPNGKVYSKEVDSVVLPTSGGEVGILAGHIPLMTDLVPGELRVVTAGVEDYLAVSKGFVKVEHDRVSILAEAAIHIDEIDLQEVEEARARAKEAIEDAKKDKTQIDVSELESLDAFVKFAVAQEMIKSRPIKHHRSAKAEENPKKP